MVGNDNRQRIQDCESAIYNIVQLFADTSLEFAEMLGVVVAGRAQFKTESID